MTAAAHAAPDPGALGDPCPPGCGVVRSADPSRITVHGTIWSRSTGERSIGATVVFTGADGVDEEAVTDEHGVYTLALRPGTYARTIYFVDLTLATPSVEIGAYNEAYLAPIDVSGLDAAWSRPEPPESDPPVWRTRADLREWFGFAVKPATRIVTRERTHRGWLAPLPGVDPARAQTTIHGAARFPGAPGIPLAFVDAVEGRSLRVPIPSAAGGGGIAEVQLRRGSNEAAGLARVVLGRDVPGEGATSTGSAELVASGPLVRDHVWLSAGLVATRAPDATLDTHGLLALDGAVTSEHKLRITALGHALGDGSRDGWGDASWLSRLYDHRLDLHARVTGEVLELASLASERGALADRIGATVGARARLRAFGEHEPTLTVEAGTGDRGGTRHRDATLAIGDTWRFLPDLELALGARSLLRELGDARATVTTPRASLAWDPTKEGRASLFVAYQRVARLDDGLPGEWLVASPRAHHEVALAASLEPGWLGGRLSFGAAARTRWTDRDDVTSGVDAWIAWIAERTFVHVGATTLDEVIAAHARRLLHHGRRHAWSAAGTLRLARAGEREGGASVIWQRTGPTTDDPELGWELAAEGYGGTDGPGARLLLGATW